MGIGLYLGGGVCAVALLAGCIGQSGVDFEPASDEAPVVDEPVIGEAPVAPLPRPITWSAPPEPIDEAAACGAIVDTYRFHGLDIGCPTTLKVCPELFRDAFGVACMQYDAASVDACLAGITAAQTCEELYALDCNIEPVWGTEPSGC